MLRNQRQIHTSINKVLDGLVFAISLWIAHRLRAVLHFEVFGGTAEIAPFEGAYVWISVLLLFVAPFVLDTEGFYSRSAWPSRAQTIWPLAKASLLITLLIITKHCQHNPDLIFIDGRQSMWFEIARYNI